MPIRFSSLLLILLLFACKGTKRIADDPSISEKANLTESPVRNLKYLALGDSYTIGQSVPLENNFPKQLETELGALLHASIRTTIIATTGWRTDNLLSALDQENPEKDHDLVTLLIGVNNQYQGIPFAVYEEQFPQLLQKALYYAGGAKEKVFVVSIPDWGYTTFAEGRHRESISQEINAYNAFAKITAEGLGITFIDITDITREGLEKPGLVASDGLHPSAMAYQRFVSRMAPIISKQLKD